MLHVSWASPSPWKRSVTLIALRAFWMGAGEQVVGLVYDETAATLEYWLDGKYQGCVFSNLPPGISLQVFRKCVLHSVCVVSLLVRTVLKLCQLLTRAIM